MILALITLSLSWEHENGDEVIVYVNGARKLGGLLGGRPFHDQPYCWKEQSSSPSIGDVLIGNNMVDAGIHFKFGERAGLQELCSFDMTAEALSHIEDFIARDMAVHVDIDGIPASFSVGDALLDNGNVYSTIVIEARGNGKCIVDVDVYGRNPVELVENKRVSLGLVINWRKGNVSCEQRPERLADPEFTSHPIRIYTLMNGGLLVVLLFVLTVVLVKNMLARDSKNIDGLEFGDLSLEQGWMALHGDVFRAPVFGRYLTIIGGAGMQVVVWAIVCTVYLGSWDLWRHRDIVPKVAIIVFVVTAPLAGFWAVILGRAYSYGRWLRVTLMSVSVVPVVFAMVMFVTFSANVTCHVYCPKTFLTLIIVHVLLTMPLSCLGGFAASMVPLLRRDMYEVRLIPRAIPARPWYSHCLVLCILVGGVSMSSIVIETYYIFVSLWIGGGYYVWSYLVGTIALLVVVSACSSILVTYVLLQNEIHHWQWTAFLAPSSTGVYAFMFALYFAYAKRFLSFFDDAEALFYLTYSLAFAVSVGLLAGGSGFCASSIFVHMIFANLKLD